MLAQIAQEKCFLMKKLHATDEIKLNIQRTSKSCKNIIVTVPSKILTNKNYVHRKCHIDKLDCSVMKENLSLAKEIAVPCLPCEGLKVGSQY